MKGTSSLNSIEGMVIGFNGTQEIFYVIKYIHVNDLLEEVQEESNLHVDLLARNSLLNYQCPNPPIRKNEKKWLLISLINIKL